MIRWVTAALTRRGDKTRYQVGPLSGVVATRLVLKSAVVCDVIESGEHVCKIRMPDGQETHVFVNQLEGA